jgi:trk system potassium uptake protein TrkA
VRRQYHRRYWPGGFSNDSHVGPLAGLRLPQKVGKTDLDPADGSVATLFRIIAVSPNVYRDADLRLFIAGGGRVGRKTAELFLEYGHQPVLIEHDEDVVTELREDTTQYTTVVQGDAAQQDTLRTADITDADAVLALTQNTSTNVAICESARELSPSVRTVARLHHEPAADDESESVDAFVFPEHAGARVAVDEALGAPVQPIADLATHLEVVALEATDGAPAAGKALADILVPSEATVIADMETETLADGETVVTPGHRYLTATDPAAADDLKKLFRG